MLSLFYYESEEKTMEELIMLKFAVMEMCAKELEEFVMGIEEKSPHWFVLARRAKYEFMERVFLELPNFIFDVDECEGILELGYFLKFCWEDWNEDGGTIQETMERVASSLAAIHCSDINEDEEDEIDEEDCFAVFII